MQVFLACLKITRNLLWLEQNKWEVDVRSILKGKTDNSVKCILPPGYPEIRGHWRVPSKEIKTRVFTGSLLLLCLADEKKKKTAVGQLYKQENPLKGDCSNPDKK